jgi:glycosyltransferase involved in cell wall biosynthesis
VRIAYVSADLGVPIFGRKGCSIHVHEVVSALKNRGADVEVFSANASGTPAMGLDDLRVHSLPRPPKGDLAAREQAALAANAELRAALARELPYDLVYERYSLWSFAAMDYARAANTPALLEVNAPLIEEQAEHRGLVDRAGAQRVAEQVFGAATGILAVSEEVAAYVAQFPGTRNKIHVVPNGVSPSRFSPGLAATLPRPAGAFTVGFVGTLKPWHGLSILVEAFARLRRRHPEARLLIVGDGPERDRLAADLAAAGLTEAVHWAGAVDASAVPGWLASMDVGVAPYPPLAHFYFSPLKVYEYMAAGLPVVASRIGQLKSLIEEGRNGLLVTPGDAAGLAAALERLQSDPELRARLGQAARSTVLEQYTWDAVAQRVLCLAGLEATPHAEGAALRN